ncbi:poly(A) polymerase pla1 [Apiospora phragmitis]|uniref:Poly(A) polymerase pla1 n=1 Tax=Apiospora phragmitis TaxID=2905665 RepID=A0ABR1T6F2_9PEZI
MDGTPKRPPTPPPLPPAPRRRPMAERPSHYMADLEAAGLEATQKILTAPHIPHPRILAEVLGVENAPVLRPAKIIGYHLTNWGDYKALVDGEAWEEVVGFACEITSAEHEHKLAYYEISAYRLAPCLIDFTDGQEPAQVWGIRSSYDLFCFSTTSVSFQQTPTFELPSPHLTAL